MNKTRELKQKIQNTRILMQSSNSAEKHAAKMKSPNQSKSPSITKKVDKQESIEFEVL